MVNLTPTIREHLDLIRRHAAGVLSPADVVEDARNPNSPLHDIFIWDDTAAAHSYRILQAQTIIRTVVRVGTYERRSQHVVVRNTPAPTLTPGSRSLQLPSPAEPMRASDPDPVKRLRAALNAVVAAYSSEAKCGPLLRRIRNAMVEQD
jgi:hypothetical protein